MTPVLLCIVALATLFAGVGSYAAAIPRGENPRLPIAVGLSLLASLGLVAVAVVLALAGEGPLAVVLPVAVMLLLSTGFLLFVHAQRKVPRDTLRVAVGDPLLPFTAVTADGAPFDSQALAGRRVLLKFFRGAWCPFCQAELQRFEAMRPALRSLGVEVVALSKDTPEAARQHRDRDGLGFVLLCDPELEVIRQYGVEHRKALEVSGGPEFRLFGLRVGSRPRFRTMAAPTTLLIDENGVIRWIDQTDDYKVRSSAERVLGAMATTFGVRPTAAPHELDIEPACASC